jgi:DNA replication and repair protein RecF
MKLIELSLSGFRNINECVFTPGGGVNVICGGNAQGKTNLLEAVWLFCGQRSFRGARDRDLVGFEREYARLTARFYAQEREQEAEIIIRDKREAMRGGTGLPPSELASAFRAVVFSPEHLSLVKAAPEVRRKFIDTAVMQIRPGYAATLSNYRRALMQRSAILKDAARHPELLDMAETFEERMAVCGEKIVKIRRNYVEALSGAAPDIYFGLSGKKERLTLEYLAKSGGSADELFSALRACRAADMRTGSASAGPHRDDLELEIDGTSARQFGSQGQQRSAALALKLAEAAVLERAAGERPIILLDDVMSELDPMRQDYVLGMSGGAQIFITCCDPAEAMRLTAGGLYEMKAGVLTIHNE